MSAKSPHPAAYPYAWLQPIRYDFDQYRDFAGALDRDLEDFIAQHATSRQVPTSRPAAVGVDRGKVSDSEPQAPPGQPSS